jgi:tetratricopeptide (TPR) repeat protein
MATGNCEQAVRAFKRATLGSYRDASDIWRNYGIANICTRKVGAAIAAFDEAIRLDHADALAYRYRADAYRSLGLLDDAIRDAKKRFGLPVPMLGSL